MAFNITTDYCGEDSFAIIGKALLGGDTLEKQCITVYPGVKSSTTLHKLSTTDLVQADGCDFLASGDVNLEDKKITPVAQKVNLELCKTDLEQQWLSAQMQAGAMNTEIPAEAGEFILDYVAAKVAQKVDSNIWMASGTPFSGLIQQMFADPAVLKPVLHAAVTEANVITFLKGLYDAIPPEVCEEPDLKIIVSKNVAMAYKQALAAASAETYYLGDRPLDFLGIQMVSIRGLANDVIVIAQTANLVMATDLVSDFSEAEVIDMSKTTGADTARVKMRFKYAPSFVYGSEIVLFQGAF